METENDTVSPGYPSTDEMFTVFCDVAETDMPRNIIAKDRNDFFVFITTY
jgi:hypothetical protein